MISTGQTLTINGEQFIVVWNGEEGLIPDRTTIVGSDWQAPKRQYTKSGRYKKSLDNQALKPQAEITTFGDE